MKQQVILVLCLTAPIAQAQDEKPIVPDQVKLNRAADFTQDVLPALRANCIACHNATTAENDLILESVEQILKGGSEGPAVVPGKPDESLLYQVAAHTSEPFMPPMPNDAKAKTLSAGQLGLLRLWITEGAKPPSAKTGSTIAWRPVNSRLKAVYSVALHENSGLVAAGRADQLEVFDVHRKIPVGSLHDPQLKPPRAHRDVVQSLAIHPSGKLIASGGYRVVKLWQQASIVSEVLKSTEGAAWLKSEPGGAVTIAGTDNVLRLFDAPGGKQTLELKGHSAAPMAVVRDGDSIVTVDQAGSVRVWHATTGAQTASAELATKLTTVARTGDHIVAGAEDGRLLILNAADMAAMPRELKGHAGPITALLKLSTANQVVSGSQDGTLRTWDVAAGRQVRSIPAGNPVTCIAISPDSAKVAAGTASGKSFVWNIADGRRLAACEKELRHQQSVERLDFNKKVADRRVTYRTNLANAAKTEADTQAKTETTAKETLAKAKKTLEEAQKKRTAEDTKVADARKASEAKPEDKGLKAKLDAAVKAQQKVADELTKAQSAHTAAEKDLDIISRGLVRAKKTLSDEEAAKKREETARDVLATNLKAAQQKAAAPASVLAVGFDNDGSLVSVHSDGTVRAWDATNGQGRSVTDTVPLGSAEFVAGEIRARASDNRLLNITTKPAWSLAGMIGGEDSKIIGRVLSLDFSPDGTQLAIGSGQPSRSGQLQVWNVESRSLLREIPDAHSDTVLDVEFSPDGTRLLSCSSDKFAKAWDVGTGKHLRSFEGHTHHVLTASWQPDMTRVATGGGDNLIKIWDAETGEQKRTITTYRKQVTGLQFVGFAETMLTCSGDQNIRTFTAGNGRNIRTFGGSTDYVYTVAGARNESIVVSGGEDGVVRVWNGRDGKVITTFAPPEPKQ